MVIKSDIVRLRLIEELLGTGGELDELDPKVVRQLGELGRRYDAGDLRRFAKPKRVALVACYLVEARKTLLGGGVAAPKWSQTATAALNCTVNEKLLALTYAWGERTAMPIATCGLTWMFDCTLRFPISPPATISTALSLSSTKSDIIRHSRGRIVPKVGHRFPLALAWTPEEAGILPGETVGVRCSIPVACSPPISRCG